MPVSANYGFHGVILDSIDDFVAKVSHLQGKDVVDVSEEALARLMEYD